MSSQIEIFNLALLKLGDKRLLSPSDDNERGQALRDAWLPQLRAELRAHAWNFAIKRWTGSPDSEAPDTPDFDYQYTWPADCLRVLPGKDDTDWTIEGRKILTNTGPVLYLRYVRLVEDASLFDSLFVDALSCRLADTCCERITQSSAKRQLAKNDYMLAIREARRINAFEQIAQELPEDDWLAARR